MVLSYKLTGAGLEMLLVEAGNDSEDGLSAAGTTQATALELVNAINEITTVAAGSGVILSSKAFPGDDMHLFNAGANSLKIYPPVAMRINGLPLNSPMTLPVNTACSFYFLTATRVMAVLSA